MSEVTESDSRTVLSDEEPDNHFSKMGLLSVIFAFVVGLALLLVALSSASKFGLAIFTDIPSAGLVIGSIIFPGIYLYLRHSISVFSDDEGAGYSCGTGWRYAWASRYGSKPSRP